MSLTGKVGVVTSSTSGIGLGIARAFAGAGADIFINGFGERDVIEGIRRKVADEYKVGVAYSGADMSKAPEIAAMIAQATKELGGVDILVNNAGIQYTAPVRDFPAEQWEAIIAINLFAAFYPTQAALPYMLKKLGSRHQYCEQARISGECTEVSLRRSQARHRRFHEGCRT